VRIEETEQESTYGYNNTVERERATVEGSGRGNVWVRLIVRIREGNSRKIGQ